MHTATELLHRQLHAYCDSWRQDRGRALAPWEVEAWVETGLSIFRLIRRLDEHLGEAGGRGEVSGLYEQWLRSAAGPLGRLNQLESQGCSIADAGDFRAAEREARGVLHVPLDAVMADAPFEGAVPDVRDGTPGQLPA